MGRLTDMFDGLFTGSGPGSDSSSDSHAWTEAFGTACPMQIPSEADYGENASHSYVETTYWRDDD